MVLTEFSLAARVYPPIWPACLVQCTDRTGSASAETVQNSWDEYLQELSFVPARVREQLRAACDGTDVDTAGAESRSKSSTRISGRGGPALAGANSIGRGR